MKLFSQKSALGVEYCKSNGNGISLSYKLFEK